MSSILHYINNLLHNINKKLCNTYNTVKINFLRINKLYFVHKNLLQVFSITSNSLKIIQNTKFM